MCVVLLDDFSTWRRYLKHSCAPAIARLYKSRLSWVAGCMRPSDVVVCILRFMGRERDRKAAKNALTFSPQPWNKIARLMTKGFVDEYSVPRNGCRNSESTLRTWSKLLLSFLAYSSRAHHHNYIISPCFTRASLTSMDTSTSHEHLHGFIVYLDHCVTGSVIGRFLDKLQIRAYHSMNVLNL